MTLKQLSQLYYLGLIIERYKQQIADIDDKLYSFGGVSYDGMPKASSPENKTEVLTARKADLSARLEKLELEYEKTQGELEYIISEVGDYQIQLILTHRFVDLMDWNEVADALGGKNTADSVKHACYRFLKKSKSVPNVPHVPSDV